MKNFFIINFLVLVILVIQNLATHEDCGSEVASLESLTVSNCDDNERRCILKRKTNATLNIKFTPKINIENFKTVVHGVFLGVEVPFKLQNEDGCKDCGVTCPLTAGQSYDYVAVLPVLEEYPRVTVDVKWELKGSDNKDLICVLIPSKIK